MRKYITAVLFQIFLALNIFAIDNLVITESQVAYQKAITDFENQRYGNALKNCEDAIYLRKTQIESQIKTLQNSLIPNQVRKAGDKITDIIPVLQERGETESIKIINYYLKRKQENYFNNSISKMLDYLNSIDEFPEVQKLMGDIYKIEGEYKFAEEYYLKALENVSVLDIPDEKYEILYLLSDISRLNKNYSQMEERLLNILANDPYFNNKYFKNSMKKTINSQKNNNNSSAIDKFFELYRADEYYSLKAYILLAEYYDSLSEYDKALELASLAVITSFTKMYNVVLSRNSNYVYEGVSSLLKEISFYDDIVAWTSENNVWYAYSLIGDICAKMDNKSFARDIYRVLANYSPNIYWINNAIIKLDALY